MSTEKELSMLGLTNELHSEVEILDREVVKIVSTYCSSNSCLGPRTRKLGMKVGESQKSLNSCPVCTSNKFLAYKSRLVRKER